MYLVFKFKPNI